MVEAVGMSGAGSSIGAHRAAVAASASASTASAASGTGTMEIRPLSPSTRSDPTTGVLITEYFSSEGQVRMQIPSLAAIAYLRSGLAAEENAAVAEQAVESGSVSEGGVIA